MGKQLMLAVAGGTGTVGSHVARIAAERGHAVKILARSAGVDLREGSGLNLTGVDAVIDVSGMFTLSAKQSSRWFGTVTRNLQAAETLAGVRHHVALSIVGAAERAPYGYYAGKAAQERAVTTGAVPWTVLRATQFFEFASANAIRIGPVTTMPRMRSQPVAAVSVAAHLVDLAEGDPQGYAPDLAGPREENMAALLRRIETAGGRPGRVIEFSMPGAFGRAVRNGSILPGDGATIDTVTFDEWLASRTTRQR